jgi:ribosome-binding protein aMBF1 (putative translation factor)
MIKNERQYRITKSSVKHFEQTIAALASKPNRSLHPKLRKAELDGLRSQMEELRTELREYEALRLGKRSRIALKSIEELPKSLIQARIAAGMTQEDFAAKLGVKPQQVQRYEATDYRSASMERIRQVIRVLGVELRVPAELRLVS